MRTCTRILLADDHAVLRSGLKLILADAFGKAEFGEAGNCSEVLELALAKPWDIVILDLSMPGRGGLDVLKEIHTRRPRIPVLVLTMHPEREYAVRAFRSGAAAYLTKDSATEDLIKAVKRVLAGGRYVSPAMAEELVAELGLANGCAPHKRLSDREFEVLQLLSSGKTVKEIAVDLSFSVNTISTYRARILKKMGMRTNAELMQYAIGNNLTFV